MKVKRARSVKKLGITEKVPATSESYLGFVLCIILFICGVIIGTFAAGYVKEDVFSDLYNDISKYIDLVKEGSYNDPGVLSVVWSTCKYHLLVVFLAFSLLGFICIPVLSGVKGFFLSFSIAAAIKAMGSGGFAFAFGLFGLGSLFSLPCFVYMASVAFKISLAMTRSVLGISRSKISVLSGRPFFFRICLCVIALIAAVVVELYVTPYFLSTVSSFI